MSNENEKPVEVPLAPHRWADVERLAAKYMKGDTAWLLDQAIELANYMDREDDENLARIFDDLLEYGAEGLAGLHSVLDRADKAKKGRELDA